MTLHHILTELRYAQKNFCPRCGVGRCERYGTRTRRCFTKSDAWTTIAVQRFRCLACTHQFIRLPFLLIGMFAVEAIEYAAFLYLRALSFQNSIAILRAWYDRKVLTKEVLIRHIEQVADALPDHLAVTRHLHPQRSGYYALDGTWLKHRGQDLVLLILLDVETLDIVSWAVAEEETIVAYERLLDPVMGEISAGLKGFFCDGEEAILHVLQERFPEAPLQLCVFHKHRRIGQIVSFVRPKTAMDREIKERVERVLFAVTRRDAETALADLERYAREHRQHAKLQEVIRVLKRNFDLLLTHFDHPEMSPYNNVLEGFNHVIKRKLRLMKGFKKAINIHRWLKLILLDWRFHLLNESTFKARRGKSPLQLAGCTLPPIYNWLKFCRTNITGKPS